MDMIDQESPIFQYTVDSLLSTDSWANDLFGVLSQFTLNQVLSFRKFVNEISPLNSK